MDEKTLEADTVATTGRRSPQACWVGPRKARSTHGAAAAAKLGGMMGLVGGLESGGARIRVQEHLWPAWQLRSMIAGRQMIGLSGRGSPHSLSISVMGVTHFFLSRRSI